MKIIAKISGSNVLVQMTDRELANIVGKNHEQQLEPPRNYGPRLDGLEVGTEYKVSEIYNRLRQQEQATEKLETAKRNLLAVAGLLEIIEPAALIIGPAPKEGGDK